MVIIEEIKLHIDLIHINYVQVDRIENIKNQIYIVVKNNIGMDDVYFQIVWFTNYIQVVFEDIN